MTKRDSRYAHWPKINPHHPSNPPIYLFEMVIFTNHEDDSLSSKGCRRMLWKALRSIMWDVAQSEWGKLCGLAGYGNTMRIVGMQCGPMGPKGLGGLISPC